MYGTTKSHAGKRSNRMQERWMNFNVPEYEKFTDVILTYRLQLDFKKLSLVEFWCNIEEEHIPSPTVNDKCLPWGMSCVWLKTED